MLGRAARVILAAGRAHAAQRIAAVCGEQKHAVASLSLGSSVPQLSAWRTLHSGGASPSVQAARVNGASVAARHRTYVSFAQPGAVGNACGLRPAHQAARQHVAGGVRPSELFRRAFSDAAKPSSGGIGSKLSMPSVSLPKLPSLPKAPSRAEVTRAINTRIEAWWLANYRYVYASLGLLGVFVLWRGVFFVASRFMNLSESLAEWGFLALALAIVMASGMYYSHRQAIRPDEVYRLAMKQLRTSADVAAALGRPLQETELRAFVMSGGRLRIKNFVPGYSTRRCHLLFPVQGSLGRGFVSVEAKKVNGQYAFKLIAVDAASLGPSRRIYLAGDADEYNKGSIISELRDPLLNTLHHERVFENEEDREARQPAAAAPTAAPAGAAGAAPTSSGEGMTAAAPKAPAQIDDGLYFYELVLEWFRAPKEPAKKEESKGGAAVAAAAAGAARAVSR